jgi:polysaccharide export outer membrane protein
MIPRTLSNYSRAAGRVLLLGVLFATGCAAPAINGLDPLAHVAQTDVPRELRKATLNSYRVEPPDILLLEVVDNIRPAGQPLRPGEDILIRASNTLPIEDSTNPAANEFKLINSIYKIQVDGSIDLGPEYGSVQIAGKSIADARQAVLDHLHNVVGLASPKVAVSLADITGKQIIAGEHLVRQDGTISLGIYGNVNVAGMTLEEVERSVESQLAPHIQNPEVRVDVAGYNSKVYYVITDGGGSGERVDRLPYTGNETVLDAVAQIQGLSDVSSKRIWVARPAPPEFPGAQIMIVDWRGITEDGVTTTNYQIFPGDRVYIKADCLIAADTFIGKVLSPVERIFGVLILGDGAVSRLEHGGISGSGSGIGGF